MIAAAPHRYLRRDLAKHFGVSERMIQKDLDIIRHGLKLDLQHSPQGYYFDTMPRLPSLHFSFQEALSLLLAVQAARQVSGIGSSELAAAIARLESLFPQEFIPMMRLLMAEPGRTVEHTHREEMLMLLNRAMLNCKKVEIVYETRSRGGEVNQRVVHPYYILPYVRSWQLIAYCEKRKDILMFKVDRIRKAQLLDEFFTRPVDFDPETYLGQSWGIMRGEARDPEDVVLHFDTEAGNWVAEEYWHPSQTIEYLPDGSIKFMLHIAVTPEFINWILYYGERVTVVSPQWLRDEVSSAHLKAYRKYQ